MKLQQKGYIDYEKNEIRCIVACCDCPNMLSHFQTEPEADLLSCKLLNILLDSEFIMSKDCSLPTYKTAIKLMKLRFLLNER